MLRAKQRNVGDTPAFFLFTTFQTIIKRIVISLQHQSSIQTKIHRFSANIERIGVNPFVFVPERILVSLFKAAGKDKGKIPIKGTINTIPYQQTLVKYNEHWRLYINTSMLKNSPKRIGERIKLTVAFDTSDRSITPHPLLLKALSENKKAKEVFDNLRPSLQLEIVRYIARLKTNESVERNITNAMNFLLGRGRFVGRAKP